MPEQTSEDLEIWTDYCKKCGSTHIVNRGDSWGGLCDDCGSRKIGKLTIDTVTPNDKNKPEIVSESDNTSEDLPKYGRCETCGSRVLITESGERHIGEDHPKKFPGVVSSANKKPETVAIEGNIGIFPIDTKVAEEIDGNELIHRSDAEEYYGKREGNRTQWEYGYDVGREEEHQQIIEMLEKKIQHRENRINSYWKTIKNSAGMARKTKYDIGVGRIKEYLEAISNNKVEISTFKEMIDKLKGENDGY